MKKKILLILVVMFVFSASLFADMDFLFVGMSGGYSGVSKTPSFGFNTAYQYMAAVGNNFYMGVNNHADVNFQIPTDDINVSAGVFLGPSMGFAFDQRNFLTFTAAPAIYTETLSNRTEYLGFGLGLDLNHTFYFGSNNDFGLTLGATSYFLFLDLSSGNKIGYDAVGYLAFSIRSGDYTGVQSISYDVY